MSFEAYVTHRSLQGALDRKFPRFSEVKPIADSDKFPFASAVEISEKFIYGPARRIVAELKANPVPAADLTEEQKCAMFTLAGMMEYRDGKMVSRGPVAITDRGDGGYILGMKSEKS